MVSLLRRHGLRFFVDGRPSRGLPRGLPRGPPRGLPGSPPRGLPGGLPWVPGLPGSLGAAI